MNSYLTHLEEQYNEKTFKRKVDYIKYNLGEIINKLDIKKCAVLEIGPGMGECVSYLNGLGVDNIDILDNSAEVLKRIAKKYKINKSHLAFVENIHKLKLQKYDLIIMIQVLEHIKLDKQRKIIGALYKGLKKGGYILNIVPNANNPLGLVERYGDLQHTASFTTRSLIDLINESGIKEYGLDVKGYKIPPYSMINLLRIISQKALHVFLYIIMIINGGVYFKIMTPNIVLAIKKLEA